MAQHSPVVHHSGQEREVTGWVGWVYFAAFLLILNGAFQTIMGIIALFNSQVYAVVNDTVVLFNIGAWGFIHLLLGIILIAAGSALFSGRLWARVVAIIVATVSILSQLMFISAYPFWSIIAIIIDFAIIYALTVHGSEAVIEDETV